MAKSHYFLQFFQIFDNLQSAFLKLTMCATLFNDIDAAENPFLIPVAH